MVRMSQWWKQNTPYIDMQGNNGSMDGDSAAAMRYTEARLSKISNELLKDIYKNTVVWAPNFDDTEMEPTVLPAKFPNFSSFVLIQNYPQFCNEIRSRIKQCILIEL